MGRRWVVTGAASGIGRSVAEQAAEADAVLFLVDRDESGLDALRRQLESEGRVSGVHAAVADLGDPEACQRVVDSAAEAMGGIDVLVSNAGAPVPGSLLEIGVDDFDRSMAVNARATWLLGRAAHPWLAGSGGSIVVTASICGHSPALPLAAYSAAKAAVLMLTRQMAVEWGPDGIRVNSVSPGPTVTGMTEGVFNDVSDAAQRDMRDRREALIPLGKVGSAAEVAQAIVFLASPAASQISGQDILVDGGSLVNALPALGAGSGQ